jgi:hypothetical protein
MLLVICSGGQMVAFSPVLDSTADSRQFKY